MIALATDRVPAGATAVVAGLRFAGTAGGGATFEIKRRQHGHDHLTLREPVAAGYWPIKGDGRWAAPSTNVSFAKLVRDRRGSYLRSTPRGTKGRPRCSHRVVERMRLVVLTVHRRLEDRDNLTLAQPRIITGGTPSGRTIRAEPWRRETQPRSRRRSEAGAISEASALSPDRYGVPTAAPVPGSPVGEAANHAFEAADAPSGS
jgi:hypothetical protein